MYSGSCQNLKNHRGLGPLPNPTCYSYLHQSLSDVNGFSEQECHIKSHMTRLPRWTGQVLQVLARWASLNAGSVKWVRDCGVSATPLAAYLGRLRQQALLKAGSVTAAGMSLLCPRRTGHGSNQQYRLHRPGQRGSTRQLKWAVDQRGLLPNMDTDAAMDWIL